VMPSLDLAIIRLGLTPGRENYDAKRLAGEIVKLNR